MSEIIGQISQAHRAVRAGSGSGDGGSVTRTVVVRRAFPAPIEDVWDACTTTERIGRWLMPVSGDPRLGGKYQLASGQAGASEAEAAAAVAETTAFYLPPLPGSGGA